MRWPSSYSELIASYRSIRPYLLLMRLNLPIGIVLVMIPALWSLMLASGKQFPFFVFLVFVIGAVASRSLGCVINDMIDYSFDKQVERTKMRPLASGQIPFRHALVLAILLGLAAFLLLFSLNVTTRVLGFLIIIPIVLYPYMKRFTYWPQAFLGLTFNWGALMGWTAVTGSIEAPAIAIYLAAALWTLGYDTIYAHQDKECDALIGVKSTALKLGKRTKPFLLGCYGGTLVLLWWAGVMQSIGLLYHVMLAISAFQLFWQILDVDLNNPVDCARKFRSNVYFGWMIFFGILLGTWVF